LRNPRPAGRDAIESHLHIQHLRSRSRDPSRARLLLRCPRGAGRCRPPVASSPMPPLLVAVARVGSAGAGSGTRGNHDLSWRGDAQWLPRQPSDAVPSCGSCRRGAWWPSVAAPDGAEPTLVALSRDCQLLVGPPTPNWTGAVVAPGAIARCRHPPVVENRPPPAAARLRPTLLSRRSVPASAVAGHFLPRSRSPWRRKALASSARIARVTSATALRGSECC